MNEQQVGLIQNEVQSEISIPVNSTGVRIFKNTADGKYYIKKSDGTIELLSVGVGYTNNTLFQNYADAGNAGEGAHALYSNPLIADTLSENGDSIKGRYAVNIVDNGNNKIIYLTLNGETIFQSATDLSDAALEIDFSFELIRTSNTTARSIATITAGDIVESQQNDISDLDFSTDMNLILLGQSSADNDVVAKFGKVTIDLAA